MHIGIARTGEMGSAIAKRLLGLGRQVTLWNRSAKRAQPLRDVGIGWAARPSELATKTEAVITMLTDGQALDDVYLGHNGLLSHTVDVSAVYRHEHGQARAATRHWRKSGRSKCHLRGVSRRRQRRPSQ